MPPALDGATRGPADEAAALRLLLRRKLRATARKQWRRLGTPKGLLFALLGGALFAFWLGSVALWSAVGEPVPVESDDVLPAVRIGGVAFLVLALFGAARHRGLYLPSEEIERLFSAPLSRASIARYRLTASLGRASFGGCVLGLMVAPRLPSALFGFLGVLSAVAAVTVLGQTASLVAGSIERRAVRRLVVAPGIALAGALLLGGLAVAGAALLGGEAADGSPAGFGRALAERLPPGERLEELLVSRWLRALTLPFEPWARAIAAEDWATFAGWFPLSLLIGAGLFELTARLPVDYRELSLETAASVAEKLRRLRRVGGGASGSGVSRRARSLRLPMLFGRGPAGALAWRKSLEIVRKARGTLWMSGVVLTLILFVSSVAAEGNRPEDLAKEAVLLAFLGTVYLCSGLRFDFRDDLDRMASIKSWPLSPTRAFVATLLPEFALVTLLVWTALGLRVLFAGTFHPAILVVVAAVPPAVFAWLALDNAVFLFAPVRFVPGQEGALQNAGRMAVLLLLRMIAVGCLLVVVGALAGAAWWLFVRRLGAGEELGAALACAAGWSALVALGALLALAGGAAYERFDVARDRG